ncbi:hypothetical protein, partial [Klebsiella pneumoniae]|uniref:hypothetical protein n=1 Tax=Klebsiella pneumoniae TaxID=573 RepID=UPI003EE3B5E0
MNWNAHATTARQRAVHRAIGMAATGLALTACVGTTGNKIVHFRAAASGPARSQTGPLEFDSPLGFHVT